MGSTKTLVFGSVCYTLWILSYILPTIYSQQVSTNAFFTIHRYIALTLISTSFSVGFGAGLVLVGSSNYIAELSNEENKSSNYSYF